MDNDDEAAAAAAEVVAPVNGEMLLNIAETGLTACEDGLLDLSCDGNGGGDSDTDCCGCCCVAIVAPPPGLVNGCVELLPA